MSGFILEPLEAFFSKMDLFFIEFDDFGIFLGSPLPPGEGQGHSWRHLGRMLGTRGAQGEFFDGFRLHFWVHFGCIFVFFRYFFEAFS